MKKILVLSSILISFLFNSNLYSQWIQVGPSSSMTIKSLAIKDSVLFAGAQTNGVFTSNNYGQNWTQTPLFAQTVNALAAGSYYVIAGTDNSDSGIFITSNNGMNWIPYPGSHLVVNCLTVRNNYVFAGTPGGIYRSTNNGMTWAQIFSGAGNTPGLLVKDSMIFAGSNGYGVYLSTNYGINWSQDGLSYLFIPAFGVSGNVVYAGACQGDTALYYTVNNGANWNKVGSLIQCVHSIVISNNTIILAAQSPGIYITTNNGQNWIIKNEGIGGGINIFCLLMANGYIFAGSETHGLWRRSLSELIGIKPISEEVPTEYNLYQNYPNPFNPSTKIKFAIAPSPTKWERGMGGEGKIQTFSVNNNGGVGVRLTIYDITGREVATLVNEPLQPGTYEVEFNGSSFASGVYFYKLSAGDFVQTKKMTLLK